MPYVNPVAVSFISAARQDTSDAGSSQASSVNPAVRPSDDELGTVTHAFVPLNESALPNLPFAAHVAFAIVPLFPAPDWSPTVVPAPSLKPYAATRPAGGGAWLTMTDTIADVVALPAASRATAVRLCAP